MSGRIRVALLMLVLISFVSALAGGALGATSPASRDADLRIAAHRARTALVADERARVVRFARHLLGVRYSYGGTSPGGGFDCSGLTRFVYAHFGVPLPHYSVAQFQLGHRVSRAGLRPGDLVFFDGLGHVGLYIGGGRFIHAPHTGTRVTVDSLSGWYASRYVGARRVL